ncbi:MAG TPA: efflux RND transporter periplasmic adaptor subunit [Thermodesulfobacteriaceae bacterium]|nr:efflux RND transporter periplasmic adaptor subunit [Thermodesulfobacteriaceae bacterium]
MKRFFRMAIMILAAGGLLFLLYRYLTMEEPVRVAVGAAEYGRVEATVSNTRSGTVKACRRARLAPSIGGRIAELPVREGNRVQPNQLLLTLWNRDLAAQLDLAENELKAARAEVAEACKLAEESERDAERQKKLYERALLSESLLDKAVTRAGAGRAACDAAMARVEVFAARVDLARSRLEKTFLRAPFPGIVAEVNGELGEFITPSPVGIPTPPAIDLIDTTCLHVSAPMDEVDAPAIKTGMSARITLDAFPGRHLAGKVSRIAPYVLALEKQARTVEIEAIFTRREDMKDILPGYSADVEVILGTRDNCLRIPTEAVLDGEYVLVYDSASQTLHRHKIHTGLSNWQYTEVVSGLTDGDLVVTSVDREGVEPGAHVVHEKIP